MNARIAALGLLLPLAAGSAVAAEEGSFLPGHERK